MSSIGWIDFSSEHREKVRTVLDLLKKRGVIDELGIGVIRDSFADRMFPGFSTIQTRAKYFTLTAYLVQRFIDRSGGRESLEDYLKYHERACRINLVERHGDEHELADGCSITNLHHGRVTTMRTHERQDPLTNSEGQREDKGELADFRDHCVTHPVLSSRRGCVLFSTCLASESATSGAM